MTRFIGRFESDASPVSRLRNGCPARSPASSRIVVPEFPQSMSCSGFLKTRLFPWTISVVSSAFSMWMPRERIAATVHRQSSLGRNPRMTHGPLLIAASITARCEMLLSPGTINSVWSAGARRTFHSDIG